MIGNPLFAVVVTAPASGVEKGTLASNPTGYLKALEVDLLIALLSLNQHAGMFRIGKQSGRSLAELQRGVTFAELLTLREFGVAYFEKGIPESLAGPSQWLRNAIA